MNRKNVVIYAGDERTLELEARDYQNDVKNLAGLTVTFRAGRPGYDALIEKTCSVTSAPDGEFSVELVAGDTQELRGDYDYQCRAQAGDGSEQIVLTGRFRVLRVVENL